MKLKKFTAPTMPEAMQQIRSELGSNAVILQSKEVKKGGVLGFFQKKQVEVVAALDPEPTPRVKQKSYEPLVTTNADESFDMHTKEPAHESKDDMHILAEIKQMKKLLEVTTAVNEDFPKGLTTNFIWPYTYLTNQEVTPLLAEEIVLHVQQNLEAEEKEAHAHLIKNELHKEIVHRLKAIERSTFTYDEHIIHFIGPTGVGKTTTLAKIAAKAKLENNKRVAFITTDTYRIAAIEQLKTYARILEVPIEVAYTKEEYDEAIQKLSDYDQIYVDTAGRNYRETSFVKDLKALIDSSNNDQATMLVLSLSSKSNDIEAIYHQFNNLPNQSVIFTKVDETRQFGSLLNISLHEESQISFLANGQDVPNDVMVSTPEVIASYILSGYDDE